LLKNILRSVNLNLADKVQALISVCLLNKRTRLQYRRRSQEAVMLLDQSAMCLRKATVGDVTREVEFLSNDYTSPNTNHKTLTTLALTLADHHDVFESFCAPVFCDFVWNYSCTVDGAVVTS